MYIGWVGSKWHMGQTGPKRQGPHGRASGPSVQIGRQPVALLKKTLTTHTPVAAGHFLKILQRTLCWMNKKLETVRFRGGGGGVDHDVCVWLSRVRWQEYDWRTRRCSPPTLPLVPLIHPHYLGFTTLQPIGFVDSTHGGTRLNLVAINSDTYHTYTPGCFLYVCRYMRCVQFLLGGWERVFKSDYADFGGIVGRKLIIAEDYLWSSWKVKRD